MNQDYRQFKEFQDYARERQLRLRVTFLRVLIGVLFLVYLASFWYYQVVRADHFQALSDSNRIRTRTVEPLRGTIVDREGRTLAKNRPSFTLMLEESALSDWEETRGRLARLLVLDPDLLEERRRRAGEKLGPNGLVLQEDVDQGEAAFIESHPERFPGVRVVVEPRRYYEGGRWASHLIGYVGEISRAELDGGRFPGARAGDIIGKAGLERRFNELLAGERGDRQVVVNALGRELDAVPGGRPAVAGSAMELAIDLDLQQALVEAFGGRKGSGVVLDARTGEVLALGSFPAFDPNLFAGRFTREEWEALARDPSHPLQNRAAQSQYSAGSTFKVVVAAAALETGLLEPDRRIYCPGFGTFYGRRFHCHFRGGHGWVNVHQALVKSCNVFFYQVGKEVGIEPIAAFARKMGLGRPTGIDLVDEDSGLVPDAAWSRRVRDTPWYPGETISVSIGQGPLLVTPLQLASLAAALGTGAFPPIHLVHSINGEPQPVLTLARPLLISDSTLSVIRDALWGVVNADGTGTRARLPDVEVAGKTGTVQVVRASVGVDSEELPEAVRDHSWFIGYAPAAAPTIAFAIFVEHGGHGGVHSAPIARRVLDVYFRKRAAAADEVQLAQR